jgi:hypothetical protein
MATGTQNPMGVYSISERSSPAQALRTSPHSFQVDLTKHIHFGFMIQKKLS